MRTTPTSRPAADACRHEAANLITVEGNDEVFLLRCAGCGRGMVGYAAGSTVASLLGGGACRLTALPAEGHAAREEALWTA